MEAEALKMQAEKLGIAQSVNMPGAVRDVTPYVEQSSILCLTSEYEGFGIVLIEAMLKGLPVIAFEYVGVHDIIEDGVDGYIIPFGDVEAYADKLRSLMSSREERLRLREAAFRSVTKFNRERVMRRWTGLFETLT